MNKLSSLITTLTNPKLIDTFLILSVITFPFTAHHSQGSLILLSAAAFLALIQILTKKTFTPTSLSLLYIFTIIIYALSAFQSANFLESYMIPEAPYLYLSIIALYFLGLKSSPNINRLFQVTTILIILGAAVSLIGLISTRFGLVPPSLPQFAGTAIDWLYLTVFISISIYFLYPKKRIFILPILLLGLTQVTALKEQDRGLDFGTTYTYLVDELKTPQRLLLGTGPSRFSIFFGRHFDGIETEVNSVPNNAQSLLLTLLCTTGLVGILSILSIYIYIYKNISKNIDVDEKLTKYIKSIYLFTALASLLLPLSTNCIITFHIITIYFTTYIKESRIIIPLKTVQLPNKKTQLVFYNTIKALILAPMLFLLFWQLRSFVADYHLDRYNQQAKKGQSLFAYNSIRSAISTYPYRADLHTQYSLVNLVLADKLTSEGISEQQDQANILGLYQQAIREATTATTLESGNYIYWKNLGIIYRELISVASNSYTYSEAAYTNAIKIAPQNPSLWLDLGVVYYKAGLFDRSCEVTSKAIELKSDWYQPHANLGLCLNKLGQTNLAKSHLETALSLTKPDSPEYQKIAEDLKNFN